MSIVNLQKRLASALRHMQWCQSCAEGSWNDCEYGREALAVLKEHDASASAQGLHIEVRGISDGEIVALHPIVLGQDGTWTHLPQYNARNGECVDLGDVLRMLAAAPVSAQGDWQPISTAPLDKEVLVFGIGGRAVSMLSTWGSGGKRKHARWTGGVGDPWRWIELPPVPAEYRLAAAPTAPTAGEGVKG